MKFLCDRCKTRYSIADERVRGKILKIRCKNCSNVITVREGMPAPEVETPEQAESRRQLRPTDYAPAVIAAPGKSPPAPALQAAFAQTMAAPAAPPPALEEEWYVSLDGDQAGPFTLAEAQAWVKGKRAEEELFCWCEGFDDWLAVEKVSHFRGLRAAPVRKAPPKPPGRAANQSGPVAAAAPADEPKPLFAAALAALEADVAKPSDLPAPLLAKATPLTGTPKAFDVSEGDVPEAPRPKVPSKPIPLAELAKPAPPSNGHPAPLNATVPLQLIDDSVLDGDFAIGEVSRVVRLADVAAAARKPKPAAAVAPVRRVGGATAAAPAITESSPLAAAASASLVDDTAGAASASDPYAAPTPLAPASPAKQKLPYGILAAAGGGLLLVIGLIVFFATGQGEDGANKTSGSGGDVSGLGLAIDDPQTRTIRGTGAGTASDDATDPTTHQPKVIRHTTQPSGTQTSSGTGTGTASASGKSEVVLGPDGVEVEPLTPDDVVAVAQRTAAGTTERCYNRALKQNPYLTVKSAAVVLTVNAAGQVTEVSLDPVGDDNLKTCLETVIKKWQFRKSTAGISTKLTLKFGQEMP